MEKSGCLGNIIYDASGHMLLYPTILGVKVVNTYTSKLVRTIGKPENFRILQLALFQVSCFLVVIGVFNYYKS